MTGAQVAAYDELDNGPLPGLEGYVHLEQVLVRRSFAQMRRRAAERPLAPIPLTVVSRALPLELPPGLPAGLTTPVAERAWAAAQRQLGRLLPRARRVLATRSSHGLMFSEPALLIREIRRLVATVRRLGRNPIQIGA